jgi:hypothetical protein
MVKRIRNYKDLINRRSEEQIKEELKEIIFNIKRKDYKLIIDNYFYIYKSIKKKCIEINFFKDSNIFYNKFIERTTLREKLIFLDRFKELEHVKRVLLDILKENNFYYLKYTFERMNLIMPRNFGVENNEIYLNKIINRLKNLNNMMVFILYYIHQNDKGEDINNIIKYIDNEPLLKYY